MVIGIPTKFMSGPPKFAPTACSPLAKGLIILDGAQDATNSKAQAPRKPNLKRLNFCLKNNIIILKGIKIIDLKTAARLNH